MRRRVRVAVTIRGMVQRARKRRTRMRGARAEDIKGIEEE